MQDPSQLHARTLTHALTHARVLLIERQGGQVPPIRARPPSWGSRPVSFDNKVSVMFLFQCRAAQEGVKVAIVQCQHTLGRKRQERDPERNLSLKPLLTFCFFFRCVIHVKAR